MLVCYLFLPLCHVIFSRRCLFLMLHLITSRFQLILQTMKPRSMTAWTHEPQVRNTLTVLLPDLLLHVSTYLAKNTRNQVEGQLWRHVMQLRDTLTVLLPDWYTQAKIARLSHKRENWSQVQAILFQNWGVVVSYQRTGVLSFPTSCISVDEDEFLHPEFRCRPSLLLLSALFARNTDAKVNFDIKHKIHLEIQMQISTCIEFSLR